jgi:stage II sporulation protein D
MKWTGVTAHVMVLGLAALTVGFAQSSAPYLLVDLRTGRTLAENHAAAIDTPVVPGSILKVVALVAALESQTIDATLRVSCPGRVTVSGRTYRCVHPDLGRPLNAVEALAHSCNVFFATIAKRLPRTALDSWYVALNLPPPPSGSGTVEASLGLASRATPRALLNAVVRIAGAGQPVAMQATTRALVLEGLRGAARYGTASALGVRGLDALAKTGTAPMGASTYQGLVVALTPAARPDRAIVVLAPGAAGLDAAGIASTVLAANVAPPAPAAVVRASEPTPTPFPSPARPTAMAPPSQSRDLQVRLGRARPGGGYDIEALALDDYVAQIVAGEMAAGSAPAALDALAITARTFAQANIRRHSKDDFDLCDLTHCQVARPATTLTREAARRTSGRVLLFKGSPAQVFYSASCGGRSELASQVWPGATDHPFLGSHPDESCLGDEPWTSEISERDMGRALRRAGFRGSLLRQLIPLGRNESGRVTRLRIEGFRPEEISAPDLRAVVGRTLGWSRLKSTSFDVERTSQGFRFTGRGMGHGVGLCVIGSSRRAVSGQSAETILQAYFPGLSLGGPDRPAVLLTDLAGPDGTARPPAITPAIPPVITPALAPARSATAPPRPAPDVIHASSRAAGGVQMVLPAMAEADRAELGGLVDAARANIARRVGQPVSGAVTLRFHPTVESFRRATGQAWWVAAATSGSTIELLPVSTLRSRGVLESTLRHELAHVATDPYLRNRALWVREGAAIHFAGEAYGELTGRIACPRDDEILNAASPGALRSAYARAGACFARALQAGTSWTDVD